MKMLFALIITILALMTLGAITEHVAPTKGGTHGEEEGEEVHS